MNKFNSIFILIAATMLTDPAQAFPQIETTQEGSFVASDIAHEKLYQAMNAPEEDARPRDNEGLPELGVGILQKKVGGLSCTQRKIVAPNAQASYACSLSSSALDPQAIYEALQVPEKQIQVKFGPVAIEKSIDRLTCQKTKFVSVRAPYKYNCSIDF